MEQGGDVLSQVSVDMVQEVFQQVLSRIDDNTEFMYNPKISDHSHDPDEEIEELEEELEEEELEELEEEEHAENDQIDEHSEHSEHSAESAQEEEDDTHLQPVVDEDNNSGEEDVDVEEDQEQAEKADKPEDYSHQAQQDHPDDLARMFSSELNSFGIYQDADTPQDEDIEQPQNPTKTEVKKTVNKPLRKVTLMAPKGTNELSPRSVRQKSIAAKKKYAEITKELVLKRVDAKHEDDAQRAAQEIKKLQLYTKEEELRRKKMLEMERKRAEAVAMEEAAIARHQKEREEEKERKRQQFLEYRLQKRAEELEQRRIREQQIQQDNQVLALKLAKSSTYHMMEQKYKESLARKSRYSPSKRRQQKMVEAKVREAKVPKVYKGRAAELAKEQERQRRRATKIQLEAAKEKLSKASQYAALVREIFQPAVDINKKKEREEKIMKSKTTRYHLPNPVVGGLPPPVISRISKFKLTEITRLVVPAPDKQDVPEVKTIPPEARGRVIPKEPPVAKDKNEKSHKAPVADYARLRSGVARINNYIPTYSSTGTTQIASTMPSTLQLGNIKLIKSVKQLDEEREARIFTYQARAKAVLDNISAQEADMMADPLVVLVNRFAKYSMVAEMYEEAINAKLDVITKLHTTDPPPNFVL